MLLGPCSASVCLPIDRIPAEFPTLSPSPIVTDAVTGLPSPADDLMVFHAGTRRLDDGTVVTSGGRVLCVTALGESVKLAQQRAYEGVQAIRFDGAQWRRDIGHRAIRS